MSKRKLTVTIVTPTGTILKHNQADMIVAPSVMGQIGILPNHAPLLTKLEHGEIKVKINDNQDQYFSIFQGFLNVDPDSNVTILADNAQKSEELNIEAIRKAKEAAEKALSEKEKLSATEILRAETAVRRAIMELKIASRRQNLK